MIIYWSIGSLSETTSLKKTDFSSPSNRHLPIVPQLGVELHELLLIHAGLLAGLSCVGLAYAVTAAYELMCVTALSYMAMSSFITHLLKRLSFFPNELFWHLCQDSNCCSFMDLFLDQFHSVGPPVCFSC